MKVNAIEQTDETDLARVQEPHYREAICDIIRGYKPEKTRDVGITAKIVLKSDKSVVRRPRRLAPSEKKEMDDLMEAWTDEGIIKPLDSECADTPSRNSLPGAVYVAECEDGLIARLRRAQKKGIEVRKILDAATCSQADVYVTRRLIDEEWGVNFEKQRRELREDAKRKIAATQEENKRNFDKRRKSAKQYLRGDLVAIKRTQFGPGLKFGGKFLGPYRVLRTMWNDRYMVEKVGEHEGPTHTSATADFMKPWVLTPKTTHPTIAKLKTTSEGRCYCRMAECSIVDKRLKILAEP